MEAALRRELREEIGIEVEDVRPALFKDCLHEKLFEDGSRRKIYMIFLLFDCIALSEEVRLNHEFVEHRWVERGETSTLELNSETRDTLARLGDWSTHAPRPGD